MVYSLPFGRAAGDARVKPRLLDLFCGAGGATKGYQRAGFHVTGVDAAAQPHYCGDEFFQLDAMALLGGPDQDLDGFAGVVTELADGALPGGVEGVELPVVYEGAADADSEGDSGGVHAASLGVVVNPKDCALPAPAVKSFDAIHASPPCQDYLNLRHVNDAQGRMSSHPRLIAEIRKLIAATRLSYVIENVAEARPFLVEPIRLCGSSFGLAVRRHRLFECSFPVMALPCAHHLQREPKYWTGWRPNGEERKATVVQVYGNAGGRDEWPAAMGIDWMTSDELSEAVPPAYTEHVGHYLMAHLNAERSAAA